MVDIVTHGQTEAFGGPGMTPRWTSSSKEGIGTAYSTSSRVWFTISHGILNEVYYPTIDRPQIRDLQFLITDEKTFFHEERRNLASKIEPIEKVALGYKILTFDKDGRYQIAKKIISDPHQPCVLIHTHLQADPDFLNRLKLYALVSPHLEMGGMGNSGHRIRVAGMEILIAWKNSTWLALGVDIGFQKTSCGFVGESDGWQDLKQNFIMDWQFDQALDGNIALMGQIDLSRPKNLFLPWPLAIAFMPPLPRYFNHLPSHTSFKKKGLSSNGNGPAVSFCLWKNIPVTMAICIVSATNSFSLTRIKPLPAPLSPRPAFRGARLKVMKTLVVTIWSGLAIWSKVQPACSRSAM
jgi:hypothetical protein